MSTPSAAWEWALVWPRLGPSAASSRGPPSWRLKVMVEWLNRGTTGGRHELPVMAQGPTLQAGAGRREGRALPVSSPGQRGKLRTQPQLVGVPSAP